MVHLEVRARKRSHKDDGETRSEGRFQLHFAASLHLGLLHESGTDIRYINREGPRGINGEP